MKVLLAVDGSKASQAAVRAVAERPWPEGTIVRVLSVAHLIPPTTPFFNEVAVNYEQLVIEFLDAATEIATRAADELEASGLQVESAIRQGDPRVAIVDEARDWSADLVIVGSHGRSGIERWLMGSVAEHVVRHAPCSVEVVRPPAEGHPSENRERPETARTTAEPRLQHR
jgi:nucleotide-binding universal stress UspA family protein